MKKTYTLLEQYEFSLKTISLSMPLVAVVLAVVGIVVCIVRPAITWVGILFIGLGVVTVAMYLFLRWYMLKRINELEQQEQNNGD